MSELRLNKIQLGTDTQNPGNNITIETPSIPDGTLKFRTGSAQGTGTDILNISNGALESLTLGGNINMGSADAQGIVWARNTDGASIKFYNTGDGDANSRLEFQTSDNKNEYFNWTHLSSTGTQQLMRLTGDGKLGIGTIAPNSKLHIVDNDPFKINFEATTGGLEVVKSGLSPLIVSTGNNPQPLLFGIQDTDADNGNPVNTEHMRITADGKLGIGTTTPDGDLTVVGLSTFRNQNGDAITMKPNDGTGHVIRYGGANTNTNVLRFLGVGDVEKMRLTSDGKLLVGTTANNSSLPAGGAQATAFHSGHFNFSITSNAATTILDLEQVEFRNTAIEIKAVDPGTHTFAFAHVFVNFNGGTYRTGVTNLDTTSSPTSEFSISGNTLAFRHGFGSTRQIFFTYRTL